MPRVKELLGGRSNLDLRNYIINGAFDYWQRGTSFALNTTTYHTDRFLGAVSADGGTAATGTVSRQSLTVGLTGVEDQEYYLRINNTTVGSSLGNNSFYVLGQRIEDVRTLSGKTITVSVWMAASTAKQVALYGAQSFGVGGSATVYINCSSNGIKTLTSTVTRYDFTVTVPSILGKTIGANSCLELGLFFQAGSTQMSAYGYPAASLGWGAAGNIDIVRFQVTEGDVVGVPFSRAGQTLSQELSLCHRYYEVFDVGSADQAIPASVAYSAANTWATNGISFQWQFRNIKRTTPTYEAIGSVILRAVYTNTAFGTGTLNASGGFFFSPTVFGSVVGLTIAAQNNVIYGSVHVDTLGTIGNFAANAEI